MLGFSGLHQRTRWIDLLVDGIDLIQTENHILFLPNLLPASHDVQMVYSWQRANHSYQFL
jgi:hypothetical protein